ncbi:MAG: pilus assembly protein CpaE [Actinomycetota bacterium]|nr:pilus assembly protein CpaE [Actinomycetota bacterium]
MLRLDLARELTTHCLVWWPQRGDRFVVRDRDMDEEVFVVSDLTVDVQEVPSGLVLGFNGTTEWALDSLKTDQVLWLPREDQLREALGDRLVRLERTAQGWSVVLADGRSFADPDVESAYAKALLATA